MLAYSVIDPVAVRLGPLAIRWYGIMYLISFIQAYLILSSRAKSGRLALSQNQLADLVTWAAFGVLLGGRLGYILFYDLPYYLSEPLRIFAVWEGGMSFHGGLTGVIIAVFAFTRKTGVSFLELTDSCAIATPIGLGLGRVGNFINGELFGRVTDVPWGMIFPGQTLPRHPSQLYEAFMEGVLLFLVLWIMGRGRRPLPRGVLSGSFLVGYGLIRLFLEFFREPDSHIGYMMGIFTRGQLLSLPMALAGIVIIILALRNKTAAQERTGRSA